MKKCTAIVATALALSACGGSSGGSTPPPPPPPPPPPDNIDTLTLDTSPLWSSETKGISVTADYTLNTDTTTAVSAREIRANGQDGLTASRIAFYQDTARLLSDDYGDTFLEIDVSAAGESIDLGSATRAVSSGCDLELAQSLEVAGVASQGTVRWVHRETVTFTDTGGTPTCSDTLNDAAGALFNAAAPDVPFDLIALIDLQAIDSIMLADLAGWTIEHAQSIAKYYKAIGDAGYELAGADQRIALDVFGTAADRADAIANQINP